MAYFKKYLQQIQEQSSRLAQTIQDDPLISQLCDKIAKAQSKTTDWSPDQFEQNEDSAQYDLFYAIYEEVQTAIVLESLGYLRGID